MNVEHEVNLLKVSVPSCLRVLPAEKKETTQQEEIKRLGSKNDKGQYSVKFGVIVMDDRCSNIFEALIGTLKYGWIMLVGPSLLLTHLFTGPPRSARLSSTPAR